MDEGICVQVIEGHVCLRVKADGKEAILQLSLEGAENMAEYLVRAVRLVESIEMQASGG